MAFVRFLFWPESFGYIYVQFGGRANVREFARIEELKDFEVGERKREKFFLPLNFIFISISIGSIWTLSHASIRL